MSLEWGGQNHPSLRKYDSLGLLFSSSKIFTTSSLPVKLSLNSLGWYLSSLSSILQALVHTRAHTVYRNQVIREAARGEKGGSSLCVIVMISACHRCCSLLFPTPSAGRMFIWTLLKKKRKKKKSCATQVAFDSLPWLWFHLSRNICKNTAWCIWGPVSH